MVDPPGPGHFAGLPWSWKVAVLADAQVAAERQVLVDLAAEELRRVGELPEEVRVVEDVAGMRAHEIGAHAAAVLVHMAGAAGQAFAHGEVRLSQRRRRREQ